MSGEDIAVYFLGPILGFVLALRGTTSLHASSALFDGLAVAFVGVGGAGKSTLSAHLALNGVPIISEDVLPIVERDPDVFVQSAYPQIRLWPASVAQLFGAPGALPKIVPSNPDWDKRYLDLTAPGLQFAEGIHPLGRVYLLQPRSEAGGRVQIEKVRPAKALEELVPHIYVGYALSKEMRARAFRVLGHLAREVPVRRLTLPEGPAGLQAAATAIRKDLADCET